jgi:ABC-type polysaccharide/polyol phosphate transport system ATPase subunit
MCIIQQQEKFKNVFLKIFLCSENSFEYIRGEAIGVVFLKGSRKSTLSNYLHK